MKIGDKVYTKKLMWCEIGGTSLHEKYGVYKGYMGRSTTCVVGYCQDELECWHCKGTIGFGDDYATNSFETFCLQCVSSTEPEPQFQVEKKDLGYG
jgi:hypothetical protein